MTNRQAKFLGLGVVLVHLVTSIIHGSAHQGAMVTLTMFGNVYVLVVITLAPLVAAALLFTRWSKAGAFLLAISMLGSFAFGVWYHFLSATNDNVSEVHGSWRSTFLWTAVALALVELLGAVIGVWAFKAAETRSSPES
jgi:hypothetical protein